MRFNAPKMLCALLVAGCTAMSILAFIPVKWVEERSSDRFGHYEIGLEKTGACEISAYDFLLVLLQTRPPDPQQPDSGLPAVTPWHNFNEHDAANWVGYINGMREGESGPCRSLRDAVAQRMAGVMFHEGIGTAPDFNQAFYWLRRSAAQGDMTAEGGLGRMYALGEGTPKDPVQAQLWTAKYTQAKQAADAAQQKASLQATEAIGALFLLGLGIAMMAGDSGSNTHSRRLEDRTPEELNREAQENRNKQWVSSGGAGGVAPPSYNPQ